MRQHEEESSARNMSRSCIENGEGSAAGKEIEAREAETNGVDAAEEEQQI